MTARCGRKSARRTEMSLRFKMTASETRTLTACESVVPSAAPAGETCLKLAAAGRPVASFNSRTSCHELKASSRLM